MKRYTKYQETRILENSYVLSVVDYSKGDPCLSNKECHDDYYRDA